MSRTKFYTPVKTIALILGLLGCIEPFEPEVIDFKSVLVVDGFISDRPGPSMIKLTSTTRIDDSSPSPESGASVYLADQKGLEYCFEETEPGVYQSDTSVFRGKAGETYVLKITRANGAEYQSDEVTLKPTPPIDSVYFQQQQRLTETTGEVLDGIQILVDSHDPSGSSQYYRYEWIETYEIRVPYPDFDAKPSVQFCYNSDTSKNIIVYSTRNLAADQVSAFEVHYVSTVSYKLRTKYSLLVRQYAIDEKAFKYWTELQRTSENLGTLFDPLPYELRGNISNVSDADEPVLGYFGAGSPAEHRIFISADELSDLVYPSLTCYEQVDTVYGYEMPPIGWCLASQGPFLSGYNLFAPPECCDCRLYGSLERPDFFH